MWCWDSDYDWTGVLWTSIHTCWAIAPVPEKFSLLKFTHSKLPLRACVILSFPRGTTTMGMWEVPRSPFTPRPSPAWDDHLSYLPPSSSELSRQPPRRNHKTSESMRRLLLLSTLPLPLAHAATRVAFSSSLLPSTGVWSHTLSCDNLWGGLPFWVTATELL